MKKIRVGYMNMALALWLAAGCALASEHGHDGHAHEAAAPACTGFGP